MATPTPPGSKKSHQIIVLAILGVAVIAVMTILATLLFTLWLPVNKSATSPALADKQTFKLPTAPVPTSTPGPVVPGEIIYTAQQPIEGFSSCEKFGFKGAVVKGNGTGIQNVQIVVWDKKDGLLALDATSAQGSYLIELSNDPLRQRDLWVQLYQNDLPVSQPVAVKTHIDCENGFQIFQINWQRVKN